MIKSSRFTSVVTSVTHTRLLEAYSGDRPLARGDRNRGAVIAIQSALSDLNRGYLYTAEIDGFFGDRTYDAVEAFQRDYGMFADGIVGRQTLSQLDDLFSSDIIREPAGISIHVGVDRVDPAHYGGAHELPSCVNDAEAMEVIANSAGYDTVVLRNEDATVSNFTSFMRNAIDNLFANDSLLITFSGHGSQLPNNSTDEEADMYDETLCFYDRMLLDDELYALLSQLREGVQVHAVFDSCHSGTVAKSLIFGGTFNMKSLKVEYKKSILKDMPSVDAILTVSNDSLAEEEFKPLSGDVKALDKALSGNKPALAKSPKVKKSAEIDEKTADLFGDLAINKSAGPIKSLQVFNSVYESNKDMYTAIKDVVGAKEDRPLSCNVVTLSACQDSQTTPAGYPYSFFTHNILDIWSTAQYTGSYSQFHNNLVSAGRYDVTPAINTYGNARSNSRKYERPFLF